jgi:hypothetical protein
MTTESRLHVVPAADMDEIHRANTGMTEVKRPEVAIVYRIYPRVSKPAPVFGDDKLRLAELCLASFRRCLEGVSIKMWVLLDGCPPEYERLFERYFTPEELELIRLDGVGNCATFGMQLDILTQQSEADLVYFAEDDYLYTPGRFREMIRLLIETPGVDFVSPYDHADNYSLGLHGYRTELRSHFGRHWRTVGSTCLTFLTTREKLRQTSSEFRKYANGRSTDASLWFGLTKLGVWRFGWLIMALKRDPYGARILASSWIKSFRQILLGRRRALWVPVPSLATHMESAILAPSVDWLEVIKTELDAIKMGGVEVEIDAPGAQVGE